MRGSTGEQNVKIIDNDNDNNILIKSSSDKSLKHYYSLSRVNAMHKLPSPLKLSLIKGLCFLDSHIIFFSLLKFFLGFIFLVLPLMSIIAIVYTDYNDKNKYYFFPFFVSTSVFICSLLIFVVIKLNDSCRMFGILNLSYERIYNFKIFKFILMGFFLLWILFFGEDFIIDYNLLKEKVAQSKDKEISSKIFNEGTFIIRLLFIFLFWDLEKDDNNEYIHKNIGYFEYEESFFKDFHKAFNKLLIPIITFCFCGILKIIFIKTKRGIIYLLLYSVTIFISFYIFFDDVAKDILDKKSKDETEEYFKDSKNKYFEIVPITIIALLLIILNTKICIVDLIYKKYYSYGNKSKNNFVVFLVLASYLLNTFGYLVFLFILYNMFLKKIEPSFTIETFNLYWIMTYLSILLIFIGYAFPFGHYYFRLLYHSTAFGYFDHEIKNKFYINPSGSLSKSFEYINKKKRDKNF